MGIKESLSEFLKTAEPWEKLPTEIPGVFVVKVPGRKNTDDRLMVEINPVDDKGNPTKRRGLYISDSTTYNQYIELLSNDNIPKLLSYIEEVNPKKEQPRTPHKVLKLDE